MDYGQLEVELADLLTAKINEGVTDPRQQTICVPLPEDEDAFDKPVIGRRVTIGFSEEIPDRTKSANYIGQSLLVKFSVLLECRRLRGEGGIYALAEKVKSILIGYKPTDCGDLWHSNHQFVDDDRGIFKHVLEFQTTSLRAQDVDGAEVGENNFTGLIINEQL